MTNTILPQVNSSGKFTLQQPFNELLIPDIDYTCIAIRKLEELNLKGIDVYEKFYKPYGLDQKKFDDDYESNASIITLKSSSGDLKSFPSSYLISFPSSGGYLYSNLAIAIELGAVPVDMDITFILNHIEEFIRDTMGVVKKANIIQISQVISVSEENHKRYEEARKALINNSPTDRAKVISLKEENNNLKNIISEYEKAIILNDKKK